MRGIIGGILSIILLSLALQMITPWWIVVVIASIIGFFWNLNYVSSFLMGFIAIFLLWGVHSFLINFDNKSLLSSQIGTLMGGVSPIILILLTATIGGIIAGLATLVGKSARSLVA